MANESERFANGGAESQVRVLKDLFAKVQAIQKKYGAFSSLFITGNFFTPAVGSAANATLTEEEEDVLAGKVQTPIRTYFSHPQAHLPAKVIELIQTRTRGDAQDPEADSEATELAPNLFYLGKSGVCKLSNNLRIAFCGGAWNSSIWRASQTAGVAGEDDQWNPFITQASVSRLLQHPAFATSQEQVTPVSEAKLQEPQTLAQARKAAATALEQAAKAAEAQAAEKVRPQVDLLLLNYWPTSITLFSRVELPHPSARAWGCPPFADLARRGKPRYIFSLGPSMYGTGEDKEAHIVGLDPPAGTPTGKEDHQHSIRSNGAFWEREPYATSSTCTTRFISLANFANPQKKKWFMALSITPAVAKQAHVPSSANLTENPYAEVKPRGPRRPIKRPTGDDAGDVSSGPNFRWQQSNHAGQSKRARREFDPNEKPPDGYSCHICGSSDHFIRECPDKAQKQDVPPEGYVCKACGSSQHYIRLCSERDSSASSRSREAVKSIAPKDCWFCLSNPQCAKHLIVDIGEDCYVALPKGQVPSSADPQSPVPGGGHVLIVPIAHVPSLLCGSPSEAQVLNDEVDRYRAAVRQTYQAYGAMAFAWEVCKLTHTRAGHMQVQMAPVPIALGEGMSAAFKAAAEKEGYEFLNGEDAKKLVAFGAGARPEYVRVDIDGQTYAMSLQSRKFNMQFPRSFLTSYLNVPERADWRACAKSDEIEKAETDEFKEAFAEFSTNFGG
ncbi:hypothetical protein K437DRAFT_269262 [Tilletiaria anomala UBC 951]|uniref:CCHC-type domain-containing protein n=1 Tax=Tilletiaria anomala (strain ATCC 24038 / CBS 436.72 / UBC 951) TaxID=1037660 RepID=A0A066VRH7_TILAU|nr:uncharacterized protein K437DRAFT_269262 [Tilletiaria anomala UBC 951]KDN42843.1 hypothetical protein K437DRAFT_269262 [Tilletiaria anomala UBC 951]